MLFEIEKPGKKTRSFVGKWKGQKAYLKVGVRDDPLWRVWFERNVVFYEFLAENDWQIREHLPELLDYGEEGERSYLVFEHLRGEVLGKSEPIREYFGGEEELQSILDILRLWQEVSLEKNKIFINVDSDEIGDKTRDDWHNKWYVASFWQALTGEERRKLQKFAADFRRKKGLLDRHSRYLCHRDFRPQNFIKNEKGIYLLDYDFIGRGTKVFDCLTFWAFLYKKEDLQEYFWEQFMDGFSLTEQEKEILHFEKLYFLYVETSELFKKEAKGVAADKSQLRKWKDQTFSEFRTHLRSY